MDREIKIEKAEDELDINIECDNSIKSGTSNYEKLKNKPQINNVELSGNKTLDDLGISNDKTYLHNQTIASDEWIINHNLDKYPSVSVIDSAENEVIGEVEYIDRNNLKINFIGSFTGKATLN